MFCIFNDLLEPSCGNSWDCDEILLQRIFLMRSMNAGSLLQLFTENCWHTRLSWSHWHYTNRWQHYVNQRTIILMGEQWTLNVWPQLLMNGNVWSSVGSTLKVLFQETFPMSGKMEMIIQSVYCIKKKCRVLLLFILIINIRSVAFFYLFS